MDMDVFYSGAWAGTQASLDMYLATLKRVTEDGSLAAKMSAGVDNGAAGGDPPRLYSKQGNIGVISISGPLNNSDSWMNEWLGFTGYPEVRQALLHAVGDASVEHIVLDIKSGGGAVSGVSDTADLIQTINAKVKPVSTYSDGMIASAAYWLGVSASSVTIGNVTEAGSIGVLVMHQEMSKMLEKNGITVNVIRSGQFKALGNSAEPLGALGRETLQAQVDHMAGLFNAHVADAKGTTADLVDKNMGQGRVFIGQQAVDVGLVDAVSNFDTFMSKVQGGIDSAKQQSKYGANLQQGSHSMPKTALTQQALAALAAGAVAAPEGVALTPSETAAAAAAAADLQAAADKATADAAAAQALSDAEAAAAAAKPANAEVVAMLQSQLGTSQAQVVQLSVDLQAAKAAGESTKAGSDAMRPVVRAAVGNLRVALGGSAAGVEALTDDNLIAEHANLAAQFDKKFKAGGVAAVTLPAEADSTTAATDDPVRRARLDATRTQTNKQK
jgi:capsid assembly protease